MLCVKQLQSQLALVETNTFSCHDDDGDNDDDDDDDNDDDARS